MRQQIFTGLRPPPNRSEFVSSDTHLGGNSYGVVYVNHIARQGLTVPPQLPFSPGAIIVREKLATADSKTPELLSVMIKREKGFNAAANDWEFLIISGGLTEIKHREKTGGCQNCHSSSKDRDFVFGAYVP